MAFALDLYGSGTPARVLCRDPASGRWEDVPATVLARLQHAVARGSGVARAALPGGRWHVFDFARMLRFDEADPAARPFALTWIDEGGNHLFPPGTTSGAEIEPSARCEVGEDEAVAVVRTWTIDGAVLTGAQRCVPTSAMLKKFVKREQELGNVKLGWYGRRHARGRADGGGGRLFPECQLDAARGGSSAWTRTASRTAQVSAS
ncbi:hypothetical protein GQ55_9G374400 [Panicum hallii var. hallii]|uniref:RCD1 WWE domain-containing protein n=1 Tax=Panicum hallii var. hallii TaxID=1504633 RepID=A0A2T7C925_9POAL|nr:hypothetical protein GQ55_9G374400 [Panicum hallii var. hallii]